MIDLQKLDDMYKAATQDYYRFDDTHIVDVGVTCPTKPNLILSGRKQDLDSLLALHNAWPTILKRLEAADELAEVLSSLPGAPNIRELFMPADRGRAEGVTVTLAAVNEALDTYKQKLDV
jgi:hypothetical protein